MEMEELKKIEDSENCIEIAGKKRIVKFNFQAWKQIEREYGSLKDFEKIETDLTEKTFSTLQHLVWIGLQDKEGINEETYLDECSLSQIEEIADVFKKAFYDSLPQNKKKVQPKK